MSKSAAQDSRRDVASQRGCASRRGCRRRPQTAERTSNFRFVAQRRAPRCVERQAEAYRRPENMSTILAADEQSPPRELAFLLFPAKKKEIAKYERVNDNSVETFAVKIMIVFNCTLNRHFLEWQNARILCSLLCSFSLYFELRLAIKSF